MTMHGENPHLQLNTLNQGISLSNQWLYKSPSFVAASATTIAGLARLPLGCALQLHHKD